jgi:hypothetical protein
MTKKRVDAVANIDRLMRACRTALYFARHEARGNGCERCDPAGEGPEVWGEIATELEEAMAAFPDLLLRVTAERDDEMRRLTNAAWGRP